MNQKHTEVGLLPFDGVVSVGVVVIGRNEGARLERCLKSVISTETITVYVDSGSTDGSVDMAGSLGAEVLELDMSIPFCAARARNVGYHRLIELCPHISLVQFIDGDCEIRCDWLSYAAAALSSRPELAAVNGWLREKYPEVSIYNRLGDLEWNFSGAGEVESVGGIFMIRRVAFDSVGGFNPTLVAGEEPELCQRLTRKGWRLFKLNRDMALHDLAMTRFSQWWRRMVRNGYGGMDVAVRFGISKFVRMTWRARAWAAWMLLVSIMIGVVVLLANPWWAVLLIAGLASIFPVQLLRIAVKTRRKGHSYAISIPYAYFTAISFLPQITGQILYLADRLRDRSSRLVEYKAPVT